MDHPIKIFNLNNSALQPIKAKYCASFLCRLRGLMFRRNLQTHEGLLLVEKRDSRVDASIHMLFMLTDLAVVWINANLTVVDVILARKWRPAYFPAQPARYTLELHPDRLADFRRGDQIQMENA
jgi:hypothetical protein